MDSPLHLQVTHMTPVNYQNVFLMKIINCQNFPKICYPHKEFHLSWNLSHSNALLGGEKLFVEPLRALEYDLTSNTPFQMVTTRLNRDQSKQKNYHIAPQKNYQQIPTPNSGKAG